jgi:hypothetical protein
MTNRLSVHETKFFDFISKQHFNIEFMQKLKSRIEDSFKCYLSFLQKKASPSIFGLDFVLALNYDEIKIQKLRHMTNFAYVSQSHPILVATS